MVESDNRDRQPDDRPEIDSSASPGWDILGGPGSISRSE
jgi:hypothetical protein